MTDDPFKEQNKILRAPLNHFLLDAVFFSVMFSFGETYISAFAVFLGFTGVLMSYIFAFPRLFSAFSQLFSISLIERFKSRKFLVVVLTFFQSLIWFFMIAIAIFHLNFYVLIIAVILYYVLGSSASPIWISWLGEFVHEKERGEYFGLRNRVLNFAIFFSLIISSLSINSLSGKMIFGVHGELIAYVIFFFIAFASRAYDTFVLLKIPDVRYGHYVKKVGFIEKLFPLKHASKNYIMFAIFSGFFIFSVYVAAPFFPEYMLNILHFNFVQYIAFSISAVLIKSITSHQLGRSGDDFGHSKIFIIGIFTISLFIFSWVFIKNFFLLIFFDGFNSFGWAIWDLISFTLLFEYTNQDNRIILSAWYNFIITLAAFLGSLFGGVLFNAFGKSHTTIFFISAILRLISTLTFFRFIKDLRHFKDIKPRMLVMKVFGILPTAGIRFIPVAIHSIKYRIARRSGRIKRFYF